MPDLREEYHQTIKASLGRELIEKNPESAPLSENTQEDKVDEGKENTPTIRVTGLDDIDPREMPGLVGPQDI